MLHMHFLLDTCISVKKGWKKGRKKMVSSLLYDHSTYFIDYLTWQYSFTSPPSWPFSPPAPTLYMDLPGPVSRVNMWQLYSHDKQQLRAEIHILVWNTMTKPSKLHNAPHRNLIQYNFAIPFCWYMIWRFSIVCAVNKISAWVSFRKISPIVIQVSLVLNYAYTTSFHPKSCKCLSAYCYQYSLLILTSCAKYNHFSWDLQHY